MSDKAEYWVDECAKLQVQIEQLQAKLDAAEATIKRVEDNIRSWDEHSTTGLESFVVNSFRAALGEAK